MNGERNSPPFEGGVAAPSRDDAKPPLRAQTGWLFPAPKHFLETTTPSALSKEWGHFMMRGHPSFEEGVAKLFRNHVLSGISR